MVWFSRVAGCGERIKSGGFNLDILNPRRPRGDYILRGHLYDLREIDGNVVAARVTFDFELRDTKTATTLWTYSYSHDEPVNGKDVAAVIAAIDRNVQSGLNGTAAGLDEYFAGNPAVALTRH